MRLAPSAASIPALAALLGLVHGSGCAHQTTFTSTPPGAAVTIDGEPAGQTPLVWDQPLGGAEKRTVQIGDGEKTVALEMDQSGINTGLLLGTGLGCVVVPALMFPLGFAVAFGGAFALGPQSPLFPVALVAGPVLSVTGGFGACAGVAATGATAFLWGRAGPESVDVDLTTKKVVAKPADRASAVAAPAPSGQHAQAY